MMMQEPLMSVNKYDKPTILKNEDATYMVLMRLLLLDPGSIQSHPKMGVGIVTKWRYSDMETLKDIELEIENQISKYLPHLIASKIEVLPNPERKGEILIKISINNVVYAFETDNTELKLTDL